MSEASVVYVVHESSVSILEESEDTLRVWLDGAPKGVKQRNQGPAIVTVEKWKYEIVEYSDPEDGPIG